MSLPAKNVSDYWALHLVILFQCLHCTVIMSSAASLPRCKSCEFQLLVFNKFPNLFVPPHPDLHNCDVNISIYFRVLLWWWNNWCIQSKHRTKVKYSINVSLINSDSESPIIPLHLTQWALSLTFPVYKLYVLSPQNRFLFLVHTLLCFSTRVFKLLTWPLFGPVPSRSKFLKKIHLFHIYIPKVSFT